MTKNIAALFLAVGLLVGVAATLNAATPISVLQARVSKSNQVRPLPQAVTFRDVRDRGLLVRVWVNDSGPFNFAIDTGAGVTLISRTVATSANLQLLSSQVSVGGISGAASTKASQTRLSSVAIGIRSNLLASNHSALIIDNLPAGVDGILDPTSAYQPFGYSIDLPNHELAAFDPSEHLMSLGSKPEGGTVVRWLNRGSGRRPFVRLGDGRIALIDTGSGFGLAVSDAGTALSNRSGKPQVRDLGSGHVSSERVNPTTVSIGDLTLRRIPTDLLSGVEKDAPILLGRDALYPFRLTFDPVRRLIEISPASR